MDHSSKTTVPVRFDPPIKSTLHGFAQGEAEQIVSELRGRLRRGDEPGARRQFADFSKRLAKYVEDQAYAALGRRGREIADDAAVVAFTFLWKRISDLREMSGLLHFERRFHQSLNTTLSDAFAHMRTEMYGVEDGLESETITEGEDGDSVSPLASLLETNPNMTFESVLGDMSAAALLKHIRDPRHAEAAWLISEGIPISEIANHFGTTDRNIRYWMKRVKVILIEYLDTKLVPGVPG